MFDQGSKDRPLYIISVAAELVNMHPQTLRLYERRGLVCPKRQGKNRLYSQHDIERLVEIQRLTQELGINLAGVETIIGLQNELDELKSQKEAEIQRIKERIGQLERLKKVREEEIDDIRLKLQEHLESDASENRDSQEPGRPADHGGRRNAPLGSRGDTSAKRPD